MLLTKITICSIGLFLFNNLFWMTILSEKNRKIKKQKEMLFELGLELDTKKSLIEGYLKTREQAEKRAREAEAKLKQLLNKPNY